MLTIDDIVLVALAGMLACDRSVDLDRIYSHLADWLKKSSIYDGEDKFVAASVL